MPDVILHHYPQSPVTEKVRIVLGMKGLDWSSVLIPRLPPKPDLMPLTGGYRLTPVMQVGADIYCDSQCIIRELERRYPEPSLFPGNSHGMAWGVSRWTDGPLLQAAIAVVIGDPENVPPPEFVADRGQLYFGPEFDFEALQAAHAENLTQLRAQFGWIEQRLGDGRDFLLGPAPGLPDALAYYLVWFIRGRLGQGPAFLSQFPRLEAWEGRVTEIGHGQPQELSAADALEIARGAEPATPEQADAGDPQGLTPGEPVTVAPDSTDGSPPVAGTVLSVSAEEIVLAREDERVGRVAVHFPRVGYKVERP